MRDLISQMQRTIMHNLHIGEQFSHLGVELRTRMLHTMSVSGIACSHDAAQRSVRDPADEPAGPSCNQTDTESGGEDHGPDQNRKVYRIQEKEAGIVAEAIGGADQCHG